MLTQAPRGTQDMLPQDSAAWQWIERIQREVCARHSFREIRTPVFEHTELFLRGVGDTTDVVQKEMYTFLDKGDRSITLKPEGTAGVVRAFIENGLFNEALPAKLFYQNCPVFRYEAPQAGRWREHHQFGVEIFGAGSPLADAEIISVAMGIVSGIGLFNLHLNINSIGCPKCRPGYLEKLRAHFAPNIERMCRNCRERYEKNPLRLIDCKDAACQPFKAGAPAMIDCLCGDCAEHFEGLKAALTAMGLDYSVDPGIVRGLDYYTKTVFEVILPLEKGEITVCGGGRYDILVETLGGPPTPGIGFGMGTERVLMAVKQLGIEPPKPKPPAFYIAAQNKEIATDAFLLANKLRGAGVAAESDTVGRSLKAQLKYAGKLGVPYVVVLGQDEIASGQIKLRDMRAGEEKALPMAQLVANAQECVRMLNQEAED